MKNHRNTIYGRYISGIVVSSVQLLQSFGREYAIFGAGKHTHWLLEQFVSARPRYRTSSISTPGSTPDTL